MHLLNTLPQRLDPGATPTFAGLIAPSLTSPASTNLTLGLGTGGTALTLASSTLAATFASDVTAAGDLSLVGNEKYLTLHSSSSAGSNGRARFRAVGSGGGSGYGGSFVLDTRTPSNNYVTELSIDSSQAATFAGAVTVSTGNLVIGTAGNGIDFSATAGTGTSELLNDYEEGTWTPSIGGNATYTTQVGSYTKIGRQVTLWFDLTINVLGTGSTQFISGVPFVPAILVGYHSGTVYWESIAINEIALNVVCQESSGTIWFIGKSAAGASVDNQVAVIGTGARFRGTLTYNV